MQLLVKSDTHTDIQVLSGHFIGQEKFKISINVIFRSLTIT